MQTYVIFNADNTTHYIREFATPSEARHWAINHLDMSQEWNYERLKWLINKAYELDTK